MDYEDYLACSFTPIKAIEILSNIIYTKCNEDWNLLSDKITREHFQELLALNYSIKLCAKHLLNKRLEEINNIKYDL